MHVLMAAPWTLCLPTLPSDQSIKQSRKCDLKDNVITWLYDNNLRWTTGLVQSIGANFVAAFTDCLWHIDDHVDRWVALVPFWSNFIHIKATTILRWASIGDMILRTWVLVCWIPMQVCWLPYSQKYWWELNLVVGPQIAIAKILADFYLVGQ